MEFIEKHFEIHGEYDGVVHRHRVNGTVEKYPYQFKSPYKRTALTIRNEQIRKYAARVSNPNDSDYGGVIRRFNYYTPYILHTGRQKFLAETVLYIRQRDDYELVWQDSEMGIIQRLSPRTNLSLNFHSLGEKTLRIYYEDELYCERYFIITVEELDSAYENWLEAHFREILEYPEPQYESLKTYRRGMRSNRAWMENIEGKIDDEVFFTNDNLSYKDSKGQNPWIYHRKTYDHSDNTQTVNFDAAMRVIGREWQELSIEERQFWNEYADKISKGRLTGFNCFTSVSEYLNYSGET